MPQQGAVGAPINTPEAATLFVSAQCFSKVVTSVLGFKYAQSGQAVLHFLEVGWTWRRGLLQVVKLPFPQNCIHAGFSNKRDKSVSTSPKGERRTIIISIIFPQPLGVAERAQSLMWIYPMPKHQCA